MTVEDPKRTLEVLVKAREKIADRRRWVRHQWHGKKVIEQVQVDTYCAVGAVNAAYGHDDADTTRPATVELAKTLIARRRNIGKATKAERIRQIEMYKDGGHVVGYNDYSATHRSLMSLYDQTIARLRKAIGADTQTEQQTTGPASQIPQRAQTRVRMPPVETKRKQAVGGGRG